MELPSLPCNFESVIPLLNNTASDLEVLKAVQAFKDYEFKLRHIFAQQPQHEAVKADHLVSVFDNTQLLTKSRDLSAETETDKEKYILALPDSQRRKNNSPATVANIKDFTKNFNLFSEQSLADLDWSNVVAAGSSVVTPLIPVSKAHNESKRTLRAYYHEQLAPASDVDLFIYGLDEEQAIEKIRQIEASVRNSILAETTTIRTKNAITIVSEYPTRHVQIVLRLYKNITEILTGFDVDCSCVAYDGKRVWASPRALAAFATQQNSIDLTRRSPSYENRLSKYSRRGFEVCWPEIDRSRIDPTIYERSFNRVVGLARLLVLEKLPHPSDRDSYAEKRRHERGRPELPWNARYRHSLPGNVKDSQPDDVPDWLEDAQESDYHTFTIPYGPRYNAKRIEKLLFKQDLLLNAEWNRSDDRKTDLHRHPAFFGLVDDVIHDCCGFCPKPETDEDLKAHEEESMLYISGELRFIKDNPGRQAIGSFNPLTAEDWADMAYTGSTLRLCRAIVDSDVEAVRDWFEEQGANINHRDHTGRTPLHLACMCSTPEIVQILIERGARIISRIYNGMTALHMAAHRGNSEIVKLLLDKSESNREEEDRREEARKALRRKAAAGNKDVVSSQSDEDIDMIDENDAEEETSDQDEHMTEGSFVKVKDETHEDEDQDEDEADFYDVDVLSWDSPVSALHLAIIGGHIEVINLLVDKYGADVMLPIVEKREYGDVQPILNLVMPICLPSRQANETVRTLLAHGASPAQADSNQISNLHYLIKDAKMQIIDVLNELRTTSVRQVVNHLKFSGWHWNQSLDAPLLTAIGTGSLNLVQKVLDLGAHPHIEFEPFARAYIRAHDNCDKSPDHMKHIYRTTFEQPIIEAVQKHTLVDIVSEMVDMGVDVNTITKGAQNLIADHQYNSGYSNHTIKSLLDCVQERIKELEDYVDVKEDRPSQPEPLPEIDLSSSSGQYESWLLRTNYAEAEAIHGEHMRKHQDAVKSFDNRDLAGVNEKRTAIDGMLSKWQTLRTKIVDKGAKTFDKLYPDRIKSNAHPVQPNSHVYSRPEPKDKPFENKTSFQIPDLTPGKEKEYFNLFEAVYNGDEDKVKELCLNADSPLQVAVFDSASFSPFSLAVLRKHYSLAKTVLDISAAQYEPPKEERKTYRYYICAADEDYHDEDGSDAEDGDDLHLLKELVSEKYTIDDLRQLSTNTKSKVSPASLFNKLCELWRALPLSETAAKAKFRPYAPDRNYFSFGGAHNPSIFPMFGRAHTANAWHKDMTAREKWRNNFSLFRYAIVTEDMDMLKFLLELHRGLVYRKNDGSSLQKIQMSIDDFDFALRLGNTEVIGEIIRNTGTLLPLATLVERSGVKFDEKPEYYQGLSVYGQKRQDWAQQHRGQKEKDNNTLGSPLLTAVLSGNIKMVEYFLSDTPLRCYEEFARTFGDDKHIKLLAQSEGGVERVLHSWFDNRSNLAIHMAVMADPSISKPVRDFLINRMPQFINVRSKTGVSPLQLAFQLKHYDAAQELINAGADQTTRNNANENLLHTIYTKSDYTGDVNLLRSLIEMLRPEIVSSLSLRRRYGDGSGAQTPLMAFLTRENLNNIENKEVLDYMLEISGERDLEVMDGAGDYPLHSFVRYTNNNMDVITYIANRRPDLLFKENGTGMTPIEITETAFLRAFLRTTRVMTSNHFNAQNITQWAPSTFLDPSSMEPKGTQYNERKIYDVLQEIAGKNPRHRSLVSLLDANETARRLAEQQTKANEDLKQREAKGRVQYHSRRYHRRMYDDEDEDTDEVSMWMNKAISLRQISSVVD